MGVSLVRQKGWAVLNDEQVMHAMSIDDMYRVERVLARGAGGVTELVHSFEDELTLRSQPQAALPEHGG